ncbi:LAFA_0C03774g1_1 [Lachancea sp. 'fantastica']|nr:LAFA_0C03774g1_1 [Lachancea sp. 'fantastica']
MESDGNNEERSLPQDFQTEIKANALNGLTFVGSTLAIPDSLVDYSSAPQLIEESKIASELHPVLSRASRSSKHVFEMVNGCKNQCYVLENYINQHWVLWKLKKSPASTSGDLSGSETRDTNTSSSSINYANWLEYKVPDLLALWGEERCSQTRETSELMGEVRMKPSRRGKTIKYRYQKEKNSLSVDPKNYLQRKYYEALYSLRVPLAYFVKSNLVRTSLLSRESGQKDGLSYQVHLVELALELEDFDRRQDEGLLQVDLGCEIATEIRSNNLSKLGHLIMSGIPDVISDLSMIFKVREIKLQIILLLELIFLNDLDSKLDNFEQKYERRLKKRVKKLAPSGLPSRRRKQNKLSVRSDVQQLDFCEKLDVYVDKLCIVEAMLLTDVSIQKNSPMKSGGAALSSSRELKKNMLDPEKEASAAGFITYVLIPHFMKKAPHAVAFISRKLKGSLYESLPKNDKLQVDDSGSRPESNELVRAVDSPELQHDNEASSISSAHGNEKPNEPLRLYRRASLPRRLPFPNLRSDSQLSEILDMETGNSKKYASATRGSSDVFINKLQKRQLPASDLALERESSISRSKSDLTLLEETSKLKSSSLTATFQRTTRRKIEPRKLVAGSSKVPSVQVEATPFGKKAVDDTARMRNLAIIESPLNSISKASLENVPVSSKTCPTVTPSKFVKETHLQVPSTNVKLTAPGVGSNTPPQLPTKRKVRRRLFAPE